MMTWLSSIRKYIFSNKCIVCDDECDQNAKHLCKKCLKMMENQASLKLLRGNIYYIWDYNGIYKKVILDYKYKNLINISKILGNVIKDKLFYVLEKEQIDYIIPVPIHKKKKALRGFNQTEEILKKQNIHYLSIKRIIHTKAMYNILDIDERAKNIKGSFEIANTKKITGKNILIFDDIITTGSTSKEIERIIRKKYKINKFIIFSLMAANTIKDVNGGDIYGF